MRKIDWANSPFLTQADIQIIQPPVVVKEKVHNCGTCGLNGNKHKVTGGGNKRILLLWEHTHPANYQQKIQLDIQNDYWSLKVPLCNQSSSSAYADMSVREKATPATLAACKFEVRKIIKELNPVAVIPMGYTACKIVTGIGKTIDDFVGEVIPDKELGTFIIPTYPVEWAFKEKESWQLDEHQEKSIKRAFLVAENVRWQEHREENIIIDGDPIRIMRDLIKAGKPFSFDYETTGIKPYAKKQHIYSLSFSDGITAWSFRHRNDREYLLTLKHLLTTIPHIGHHTKFENIWTRVQLGYWMALPYFDTMYAVHCLNSQKPSGLKWNCYVKLGLPDYSEEISPWLKGQDTGNGDNGTNNIDLAPEEKVLKYNAQDSLYTYWLYEYCQKRLAGDRERGLKFLIETGYALSKAEFNGLRVDMENTAKVKEQLKEQELTLTEKCKSIAREIGWDRIEDFRPSANADIEHLLFDILGETSNKKTEKGGNSTDIETLSEIDSPIIEPLLTVKKIGKLLGTYIAGLEREVTDGYIHPHFNLHTVKSFRSSSTSPNFQNFPKRDKFSFNTIRSLLYPYPGQKLFECITADTRVETNEGALTILEIIDRVEKNIPTYVFGFSFEKNRIALAKVLAGGKTQEQAQLVKVTLDNNKSFRCKLTKPVLGRNGEYILAKDLKVGDSLMPFYKAFRRDKGSGKNINRWFLVPNPSQQPRPLHWFVCEDILGRKKGQVLHHIDFNPNNNSIDNLLVCTQAEHFRIHAKQMWKEGKGRCNPDAHEMRKWLKTHREEWLVKNREGQKNRKPIDNRGEKNPMCGRHHSTETLEKLRKNNHKVIAVDFLDEREDVYCIEVDGLHNFALECGCVVHNCDLKAAEVATSACYNKDPTLINYVIDKKNDMHRDTGEQLFIYNKGELPKADRTCAKSSFVFPEFYGSYFKQTAPALWKNCSKETRQHLKEKGINTYERFEAHVRAIEEDFWGNRFAVYTQWKKKIYNDYIKNGYIDSYTGFRYYAPMSRNEVLNFPTQGSAHHILLYLFKGIVNFIEEKHLNTRIIGQIHDSIVGSIPPEEEEIVSNYMAVLLEQVQKDWNWLIVPIEMELSICDEVDQPWNLCKEKGMITLHT